MTDRPDSWTFIGRQQPSRHSSTVLVSTPVQKLSALRLGPKAENALLREGWDSALNVLPNLVSGHRLAWRSFVFECAMDRDALTGPATALLNRLITGETGRTTWYVALAPLTSATSPLRLLEDAVSALEKRKAPSMVVLAG